MKKLSSKDQQMARCIKKKNGNFWDILGFLDALEEIKFN